MKRIGDIILHGTFSCIWRHFILSYIGGGGGGGGSVTGTGE